MEHEEEKFLLMDKNKFKKTKYIAAITICFGIILILCSLLMIFFLKEQNKLPEYAKIGDIVLNRVTINNDRSGQVEIFNRRKEKINISGYFLMQLPRTDKNSIVHINKGVLEEEGKHLVRLPPGYFNDNSTLIFQDPSGREYLDIIAYDDVHTHYYRYPDGSEWFFEENHVKKKMNEKQSPKRKIKDFEIHIFDVGQGDSQLIIFPSGYTIFIDLSENNWNTGKGAISVAKKLENLLPAKKIDVVVISHLHLDHMGF